MSKRVSTRWYIGAWIVWAISVVAFFMTAQIHTSSAGASAVGTAPASVLAWIVAGICSVVMLVMWIGALIRLGQLGRWGWFAGVLVLQLIALGIIGMIAYAAAGPEDAGVVTRPYPT